MSDEQVIQQINESRANQALREHLAQGNTAESFKDGSALNNKVVEDYTQKDESAQQQFSQKGWKNG